VKIARHLVKYTNKRAELRDTRNEKKRDGLLFCEGRDVPCKKITMAESLMTNQEFRDRGSRKKKKALFSRQRKTGLGRNRAFKV